MGKLFKIDIGDEDELFLGYHQKKLYQHFRTCCKNKLKQLRKQQKKLNRKYFENNNELGLNNHTNTILSNELNNELNYYYELNKYAMNVLNNNNNNNNNNNSDENNDIKIEDNNNDNNNNNTTEENDIIGIDIKNFNYNDYKSVLSDIACNDNTPNYKIFKKIFEDQEKNKKQIIENENDNNTKEINSNNSSEIYCCIRCGTHLTKKSLVMDENFHGRTGPSFLIQSVFNIDIGPKATRKLHTGMHVVSDIFCKRCSTNVGWYYHEASKLEQQYKISHYVLECCLICTKKQYIIHNYYYTNNLLPNLNYSITNNSNNNNNNNNQNEQEEYESDDNDDTMNDLTKNIPLLPPYMSYSHPSYCGKTIKNEQVEQQQVEQEEQSATDSESEQIGNSTDSESDDESDNETAERISSIDNDNIDDEDETEEVDVD